MTLLLNASRSVLAHASLAHLTPELLALDDIIQSTSCNRLPAELLLSIRAHLVSQLTASLITESARALVSYEESLASLLCPDCVSYNTDIYGADVWDWPWDQFSGPCLCQGDIDDCLIRTKAFTDKIAQLQCDADKGLYIRRIAPLLRRAEGGEVVSKGGLLQFSPQLLDANFFLELHLSRQARRLARLAYKRARSSAMRRRGPEQLALGSDLGAPLSGLLRVRNIWDAVAYVLRGKHGCEGFESPDSLGNSPPSNTTISFNSKTQTESYYGGDIIELGAHEFYSLSGIAAIPSKGIFSRSQPTPRRQNDRVCISLLRNEQDITSRYVHQGNTHQQAASSPEFELDNGNISCVLPPASPPSFTATSPRSRNNSEDPWITRTRLVRASFDLGLEVDYSSSYNISPHHRTSSASSCTSCNGGASQMRLNADTNSEPSSFPSVSESPSPSSATKPCSLTPCLIKDEAEITSEEDEELVVVAGAAREGAITAAGVTGDDTCSSNDRLRKQVVVVVVGAAAAAAPRRCGAEATPFSIGSSLFIILKAFLQSYLAGAQLIRNIPRHQVQSAPLSLLSSDTAPALSTEISHHHDHHPCACVHPHRSADVSSLFSTTTYPEELSADHDHYLYRPLLSTLQLSKSLVTTCLCVPFTLMSLALTILCFYSRPRSLRIL